MPPIDGNAPATSGLSMPAPAPGSLSPTSVPTAHMPTPGELPKQGPQSPQPPSNDSGQQLQAVLVLAQEERERRAGLDRKYDQRMKTLETGFQSIQQSLEALLGKSDEPPTEGGKEEGKGDNLEPDKQTDDELTRLLTKVSERLEALEFDRAAAQMEKQRDTLIAQLTKPEGKYASIPLAEFAGHIELHEDPEKQAAAISAFADKLSSALGLSAQRREESLLEGMTAGGTPVAGADTDQKEAHDLWAVMNDPDKLKNMTPDQFAAISQKFDEVVGDNPDAAIFPAFQQPWPNIQAEIARWAGRIQSLESRLGK